ncbi:MAG TPA: D-alanyl-D-alanine dipeptidase [Candidatus Babeliales bacterium]|nr:D-alanyl-D-alanine dipeptidase [Candidatus Babeliales bacterium]
MKLYTIILSLLISFTAHAIPLFDAFPDLTSKIQYVALANLPTPIQRCNGLEKALDYNSIFIKRDDLTGSQDLYGGNKVRKLEFLLADAIDQNATDVITFGCTGTNHGLATACYCKQLGLNCTLMLKHQPNSPVVRQNLLLDYYFNAITTIFPSHKDRQAALEAMLENNKNAYFIPTGGSNPLGALGFVNAAFELKEQIKNGSMPEPDFIYVPTGSCGTTAGLLLGLTLANIQSKVVAVLVEPEEVEDAYKHYIRKLFIQINELLNSYSSTVPLVSFPRNQMIINKDFCGTEYGQWLRSGDDAARLLKGTENIIVEGTYSAKPIAALIADIANNARSKDQVVLLWNTYCGLDFSHLTKQVDYKKLNPDVQSYFEDAQLVDIQKLYPNIQLDLKFATTDNFTKKKLYNSYQCLLIKPVAEALNNAAQEFATLGYTVKIWDGYRPPRVSAQLWQAMPNEDFIADPKKGGARHNRGCAVDLTLVDSNNVELDMGTYFCHFSPKAFRNYLDLPEQVLRNRKLLETVMEKHGFVGLPTEWWHFDYQDWLQYPILNVDL